MNSLFYSRSLEEERERVEVCDCQSLLFPRCPFIQQLLLLLLFLLFRLSLFDQCVFDLRHRCEDGRSLTECSRVLTDKSSSKKNTPLTASSSVKTSPPSSSTCFVIIFSVFFCKKKKKTKEKKKEKEKHSRYVRTVQPARMSLRPPLTRFDIGGVRKKQKRASSHTGPHTPCPLLLQSRQVAHKVLSVTHSVRAQLDCTAGMDFEDLVSLPC